MALLIALMALGVVAGYLLRRHARVQRIASIATTVAVYGLLLSLGIALGSSGEVRTALPTLGGQALVIAALTVAGSVLPAWLLARRYGR